MRVLLTTMPAAGHLRSLIPLAHAALRQGHAVAVCAPEPARSKINAAGLTHLAAGTDWVSAQIAEVATVVDLPRDHDRQVTSFLISSGYPGSNALAMARDVIAQAKVFEPDVIVRENAEFGGYLAAEALRLPHVSVGAAGASRGYLDIEVLAPALDVQRTALGLAPDPRGARVYAYLHANLMPACYDEAEMAIPNVRCYRQANPEIPGEKLPGWVAELDLSRPLVLAAFGTMHTMTAAWDQTTRAVIDGAGRLDCQAIISVGAGKADGYFGKPPLNVRVVEYLPQPLLLESADLFVNHGGFNSIRESLRLGVPMVIIPWLTDSTANARNCERAGVALTVARTAATAEPVEAACRAVLDDVGYRRRAQAMRLAILTLPSVDQLVADIAAIANSAI